ncbi:MAG: chalcone isomerase family protein [Rhodoferax sp.]|nr:chalcone isomerase family protein [Rhodoferax sp.]
MASVSAPWPRRAVLRMALAGAVALPLRAQAEPPTVEVPPEVAQALPQGQPHGAGRLRYLLWDVFDATLWTLQGFRGAQYFDHAFALELRYLRKLSGASLVESSVQEMRRVGSLDPNKEAAWTAAMQTAFVDVQAGDRITGVHRPGAGTRFFFNGRLRGTVDDAAFARAFFGIWLGATTSEPSLRSALLAGSAL